MTESKKPSILREYEVLCSFCGYDSTVYSHYLQRFCPICGNKVKIKIVSEELDYGFSY